MCVQNCSSVSSSYSGCNFNGPIMLWKCYFIQASHHAIRSLRLPSVCLQRQYQDATEITRICSGFLMVHVLPNIDLFLISSVSNITLYWHISNNSCSKSPAVFISTLILAVKQLRNSHCFQMVIVVSTWSRTNAFRSSSTKQLRHFVSFQLHQQAQLWSLKV